ncbi:glutamyl-tRNA amidotransferase subunit A [Didymella exigua CBS 183.55]|uniref:Glutamyl-tRNA amidotransferase subunit A n=1 Tax=Didymella exigua CBS 183.55 TaxID=1150837 RepID=A0A6A5R5L6_9PLEO|nr:glutamyl-tRNA amidotransferase subunit A [Didymella exigua CBS 183.55]KAF1922699.1 glutamyl-tRNA amidotransferase subunit A [Didymella exigua CBS 183.55]
MYRYLTTTSVVVSSLTFTGIVSAQNASSIIEVDPLQNPFPYYFPPQDAANTSALFPMPDCQGITLEEATVDQLADYMESGVLTSTQLLRCYLRRVRQVDGYIGSVMEINPDAEEIAAALDAERAAGVVRGPLHGIPFLVKDNIATKDRMETTCGSPMLLGSVVPRDAHVVAMLRRAGAVLMGKATLSEWADMRSNNYSEGYSPRGGQARSAYNLALNPGGSSSGSAAAVAANVVTFSLGTETDGSVINPAERNALVGIKPTVGLTSRAGVVPECEHQDSVGTFGRTVRDAAYAFDAIHGVDPRDNYTLAQKGKTPPGGYMPYLKTKSSLQNATFGIPWASFWKHADADQLAQLLALVAAIKAAGATVLNNTEIPNRELTISPDGWNWDYGTQRGYPNESEYTVVKVDFYNNIKTYLSGLENTDIRSLEDMVAYNYANDGTQGGNPWPLGVPAFYSGQDGFLAALETKGVRDSTYHQALAFTQKATREDGIDAALANNGRPVDVLLAPADVGQSYQLSAQAGYPVVTIPAGVKANVGMPFGLALMGTAWSEGTLLKWASAIEDLQLSTEGLPTRTLPKWYGYRQRNIPVPFLDS